MRPATSQKENTGQATLQEPLTAERQQLSSPSISSYHMQYSGISSFKWLDPWKNTLLGIFRVPELKSRMVVKDDTESNFTAKPLLCCSGVSTPGLSGLVLPPVASGSVDANSVLPSGKVVISTSVSFDTQRPLEGTERSTHDNLLLEVRQGRVRMSIKIKPPPQQILQCHRGVCRQSPQRRS